MSPRSRRASTVSPKCLVTGAHARSKASSACRAVSTSCSRDIAASTSLPTSPRWWEGSRPRTPGGGKGLRRGTSAARGRAAQRSGDDGEPGGPGDLLGGGQGDLEEAERLQLAGA